MARCLNNPALRDNAQGKYPEAERLVKRALAIREISLGPGHPDLATTEPGALRRPATRNPADPPPEAVKTRARAKAIRASDAERTPVK